MSRSLKGTDDDAGVNDESPDLKCVLCEKKGMQQLSEEIVLSNFPLDINLCRSWVKNVGIKELVRMPIRELNASMYLCQNHFHPKCFVKKRNSIFLIAEAEPTEELYYRMLSENIMADFPKEMEQSQSKSSGKTLNNEDSDTIELYKCIICKGNSKPGQSKLLSRFPVEPDLPRFSRVSLWQLETLWELLNSNRDIATAYNRSLQAKERSQRKWTEFAGILNGDGIHKDWRGWAKYWVDYKAKLKSKVAASRSAQDGKGSSNEKTLTEIELKFVQILDDAQSLRVQVKPFSKLTNSGDLDSKSSEYHSRTLSPTTSTNWPSSLRRRRSCNPLPMSQGSSHTPVATTNSSQQQSFDQKGSRVTLCQLEMLYEFLNANRDIATACNRSSKAKERAQKKWTEFADVINAQGDGILKDWRGWAKYWVDYKAKIKVKAVRSAQAQAEGESPEQLLSELEGKFLQLLGDDFDQNLSVVLVEPELQNVGDASNLDMQSFELTSLPASFRANSPEAFSNPPPTTQNDSTRAHPAKSTPFRRQTRGLEASSSNIPNPRSRSPIRRPKVEPIAKRESRDPSSASNSLSNSPERRRIWTNRETPRRIRHASSPRQASSSPLPGSRSSIRRRQRYLPVMTQQDARRALVRNSHTTAKAAVRSYRALERISEGVSELSKTAKRIERLIKAFLPRDTEEGDSSDTI